MPKPSAARLKAELYDPLAFLPAAEYASMHRAVKRRAIIKLAIGMGIPVVWLIPGLIAPGFFGESPLTNGFVIEPGAFGRNARGALILGGLTVWLIGWGLYELARLRQLVIKRRRGQLLFLYPELQTAEVERLRAMPRNSWPKRIALCCVMAVLMYVVVVEVARALGWITFR